MLLQQKKHKLNKSQYINKYSLFSFEFLYVLHQFAQFVAMTQLGLIQLLVFRLVVTDFT